MSENHPPQTVWVVEPPAVPEPEGEGASVHVLAGALVAALTGAAVLAYERVGANLLITALAVLGALAPLRKRRMDRTSLLFGTLAVALLGIAALRDAGWIVALSVCLALPLLSYATIGGKGWLDLAGGGLAPLASIFRMVPWLERGVRAQASAGRGRAGTALRSGLAALLLLVVFGALLASADAAFDSVIAAVLPDLTLPSVIIRCFLFLTIGLLTLALAHQCAEPPSLDGLITRPEPAGRLPWAFPLAALNLLFVVFAAVQATVLFAGDKDALLRSTGLSYSQYARQGFFQLVAVTVLVLAVVAIAYRFAPLAEKRDRVLVRVLLGLLCALTLVIVAVALRRMSLYEEASGWTRLRLWVHSFELWLGLVFVLIGVAGVRLRGAWLPRTVAATGAAGLLVLGLINPDAFIAGRNVDRVLDGRHLDTGYLRELSADAVPALDRLPEPRRSCLLGHYAEALGDGDAWPEANLSRSAARDLIRRHPLVPGTCPR
ncbi:DUF4173 domain-containing protein [Actinocorallia longicatena]|uniref:DUF4173 domain-containing protein n=1 Tax=Actinocorallia longicatena TaxID=111803 RepID=A0ABP6Q7V3_9ACTN